MAHENVIPYVPVEPVQHPNADRLLGRFENGAYADVRDPPSSAPDVPSEPTTLS